MSVTRDDLTGQLLSPQVTVDGSGLPRAWTDALVELRVERRLRLPARCTLRFSDPRYELCGDGRRLTEPGRRVQVQLGGTALITAEVTGVEVQAAQHDGAELVVVAHDLSYKLLASPGVKGYLQRTVSDVVTAVAQSAGLTASVHGTPGRVNEYLLQVESDLALLNLLADRCGCDWWVEDTRLHFAPPSAGRQVTLQAGKDLLEFAVRASSLHPSKVTVSGWDERSGQQVTTTSPVDGPGTTRGSSDLVDPFVTKSTLGTSLVAGGLSVLDKDEATHTSEALAGWATSAVTTASGRAAPTPELAPGCTLVLKGAGPASGTYPVTQVEHVRRRGRPTETRFVAGDRRPSSLVDHLGGPADTSLARHARLHVAVVTNVKDPDGLGRVKVKYPELSEEQESPWARVVAAGAGDQRGVMISPEVNDEVLVGFEGGDLRRPVVLGPLHGSRSRKAPSFQTDDQGQVVTRRIVSRKGHVLELSDGEAADQQHVLLELKGGEGTTRLRLGGDGVDLQAPSGCPLTVRAGEASVSFDDQGNVTIRGVKVTIEAKTEVTVKGGSKAALSAPEAAVEATGKVSVKGAMASLEGSGQCTVKGGMVAIN